MNGFNYDNKKKEIEIVDGMDKIIWQNVEEGIAQEAGKMYGESKSIDDFLTKNNCKRFWGNNKT